MKYRIAACILLLSLPLLAFAQKQNAVWVGGDRGEIDFNSGTAISLKRPDKKTIDRTSASICDSNGNLLFYTNGFRVFNRLGEVMQNGDSLNMGDYISYGYGYNATPDGAVIIPNPAGNHEYYLFYTDLNYVTDELGLDMYPTHLLYSMINFGAEDTSLGYIDSLQKNIVLLSDTLTQFGMQAVKHGNGRDWWLICHEYGSNRYYKFLITPSGIQGPFTQDIGIVYQLVNAQISSPMKFSIDGSLFVHQSRDSNIIELMDFDRCSGQFFNYRSFQIDSVWVPARGVSISPSKQFVYVSSNFDEILQFDITKTDIFSTRKVVGTDNGIEDPFEANYYLQQLGPDGKIYIVPYDFDFALHVINSPDSAGTACDFVEWGFPLFKNADWGGSAPNIPNYNLDPSVGSGCDTVITNVLSHKEIFTYGVYPNPCTGRFQLSITGIEQEVPLIIYNEMGEVISQATLQPVNGFIHGFFNLENEPSGIYLLKAKTNRGEVTEKILRQ